MPKINVYLPDDLAEAVRDAKIPVSSVCQSALETAVREVTALREHRSAPAVAEAEVPTLAFYRYTNRARRAVALAKASAGTLGHSYIGTEHILIGLLEEGGNLALKVLDVLGVSPDDVHAELDGFITQGESGAADPPFTPLAKKALEEAGFQAIKLGHNYVGCEHLLLGLVAEPEGLAGQVLRRMGVELRIARRTVISALAGILHDRAQQSTPAKADPMAEILRRLEAIEARLPQA